MTLTVDKRCQIKLTLQRHELSRVGAQPDWTETHWPSTNLASPLGVQWLRASACRAPQADPSSTWSFSSCSSPTSIVPSHSPAELQGKAKPRKSESFSWHYALCSQVTHAQKEQGSSSWISRLSIHFCVNGSLLVQKQGWSQWMYCSHFLLASFLTLRKGRELELCELVGKYCGQALGITACVYHIICPSREEKLSYIQKRWNSDSEEFSNLLRITEIVRNWVKI